ncbi:hypothetical protein BDZ94DRAFT_1240558 [Collybia nuda]|uniref:Uncharacterized protein n=1 Tax=Collybia nuda TaxID=64659 RepID=A0A9P6C9U3_9AGAR|nr:hypothetical protein BDZ94DRAFT_1240558 [Collybia nuda]
MDPILNNMGAGGNRKVNQENPEFTNSNDSKDNKGGGGRGSRKGSGKKFHHRPNTDSELHGAPHTPPDHTPVGLGPVSSSPTPTGGAKGVTLSKNPGAIVGISLGAVAFAIGILALLWFMIRRRASRRRAAEGTSDGPGQLEARNDEFRRYRPGFLSILPSNIAQDRDLVRQRKGGTSGSMVSLPGYLMVPAIS